MSQHPRPDTFYEYYAGHLYLGCGFHSTPQAARRYARTYATRVGVNPDFAEAKETDTSVLSLSPTTNTTAAGPLDERRN